MNFYYILIFAIHCYAEKSIYILGKVIAMIQKNAQKTEGPSYETGRGNNIINVDSLLFLFITIYLWVPWPSG